MVLSVVVTIMEWLMKLPVELNQKVVKYIKGANGLLFIIGFIASMIYIILALSYTFQPEHVSAAILLFAI